MAEIAISQPLIYVSWACRRCGHTGGVARTTFPIATSWSESMGRVMFQTLRDKLVRSHQRESLDRGRICVAIPDDFVIGRYVPPGKEIRGLV